MTTRESPDQPGPADKAGKSRKPGWLNWGDHPVVAVLAVLASVATIVQLITGLGKEEGTDQQLARDLASSARLPVVEETAKCTEAAGRWDWLTTGAVVTIAVGGTLMYHRVATDPLPMLNGTWDCDARDPRFYTFHWIESRLDDTLRLSRDGRLMAGANMKSGFKLSGTRGAEAA